MTTLTQSELDDLRQHATHKGKHLMAMTGHEVLALLDHIAELTERDERKEQALLKIIERKEQALLEITIHRVSKRS